MKYLLLIDQKDLSELDRELLEYLMIKNENNRISLRPFLDSVDRTQIKEKLEKLDKLEIKDRESILNQIFEDKKLVYLLDSEEGLYNIVEELLRLTESHPAMRSYLVDKDGYR